jgi:alkanesulfonate monooxygenase SsuD/methylene tetrahydromethanopterin reductase-like flavin-dependent oxidoreductase (luciferase family)
LWCVNTQWGHVALQVGVHEQEAARRRSALRCRQRLSLTAPREAQHGRACGLGALGGRVAGAVVGDDHLCARKLRAERLDGAGDRILLVAGGDQDRQ